VQFINVLIKKNYKFVSLFLSCFMGSVPVGVHDIFHEICLFRAVHRQSVEGADIIVAPVY